jgi:hypothetical protein
VGVKKRVKQPGTSYITDDHYLVTLKPQILESFVKGMCNSFMGAPMTKNRGPVAVQQAIQQ